VTWNDARAARWKLAFEDVEVGAADAAGKDAEADLAWAGDGGGEVAEGQRGRFDGCGIVQDHGVHGARSGHAAVAGGRSGGGRCRWRVALGRLVGGRNNVDDGDDAVQAPGEGGSDLQGPIGGGTAIDGDEDVGLAGVHKSSLSLAAWRRASEERAFAGDGERGDSGAQG